MEVALATSPPIRSSMRRSTPGIGEGDQFNLAACTTARRVKSALISKLCLQRRNALAQQLHDSLNFISREGLRDALRALLLVAS
jgi:hypothetical protein